MKLINTAVVAMKMLFVDKVDYYMLWSKSSKERQTTEVQKSSEITIDDDYTTLTLN